MTTRPRLLLGLGAAFLAAAASVVAAVLLVGHSTSEETTASAPVDCLEKWNGDEGALAYARHNRAFHGYGQAQVGYLPDDGTSATVSSAPSHGRCVVIFPRRDLDPEIEAAGEIEQGGSWVPLSEIVDPADLAAMQGRALGAANARPTEQGELVPL